MRWKSRDPKVEPSISLESMVAGDRTVIGQGITIEGTIRGRQDIVVHGTLIGKVDAGSNHFTVGPKGVVEAEIKAQSVTISGRVKGDVRASQKVAITREAEFNGELRAGSMSVEDGAFLKAMIELQRDPEETAAPVPSAGPQDRAGTGHGGK